MRFKIDWASLIVGSKFTVFALFYFVFEGNFPSTSSLGLIFGGAIYNGGFFALPVSGLIHGGAYFRNFTVFPAQGKYVCGLFGERSERILGGQK